MNYLRTIWQGMVPANRSSSWRYLARRLLSHPGSGLFYGSHTGDNHVQPFAISLLRYRILSDSADFVYARRRWQQLVELLRPASDMCS